MRRAKSSTHVLVGRAFALDSTGEPAVLFDLDLARPGAKDGGGNGEDKDRGVGVDVDLDMGIVMGMGTGMGSHNFWQARQMTASGVPHMGYTSGHGHQQHDAKMAEKIVTELQVRPTNSILCSFLIFIRRAGLFLGFFFFLTAIRMSRF